MGGKFQYVVISILNFLTSTEEINKNNNRKMKE